MVDTKAPVPTENASVPAAPKLTQPIPEVFAALVQRVERDVFPWLPREPNYPQTVYGTLVTVAEVNDPVFDPDKPPTTHTLLILDPPGEAFSWGVHCLHRALRREIAGATEDGRLTPGALVAVSYRGTSKKPPKAGRQPAEIYRLTFHTVDGRPSQLEVVDHSDDEEPF